MFTKLCQSAGNSLLRQLPVSRHCLRNLTSESVRRHPLHQRVEHNGPLSISCKSAIMRFSTNTIPIAPYEEVKDLPRHPEKLLIDVREPEELLEFGQIPTSINIPLGLVSQELSPNIDAQKFKAKYGRQKPLGDTELIFHCKIGKRSLKAAEAAMALGYKNIKNYEGSWLDWAEREGLPNIDHK